MSQHLDLGCGAVPRNPYGCDDLYGVDLAGRTTDPRIRGANLALRPIPFDSDRFDSVSAYDFLEHVPRVLPTPDGQSTRMPFVELMNEVWRVLRPGGMFYASTPVYPAKAAFQDPTHVNFMTVDTHRYFCRPEKLAAIYGFTGEFLARRVELYSPDPRLAYTPPPESTWRANWRRRRRLRRGEYSHVLWELEAVK
jgi:SAM-dependent methyltransferase